MSKTTIVEEFDDVNDVYDTEIGDEDYGFILGPDGELKSVFTPEKPPFATPENVIKILQMFGINDVETIDEPPYLH